jgi:GGDEF domain-containing protein
VLRFLRPYYIMQPMLLNDIRKSAAKVSFRTAQSERYIAYALAGLTFWINIILKTYSPTAWGAALLALAVGFWCRSRPAKYQVTMALRAALLLAAAGALMLVGDEANLKAPYVFWTLAIATGYALLLTLRWAVLISLAALALGMVQQSAWTSGLVYAGFLCVWPMTAMVFARTLQRTDKAFENGLLDKDTGLYNTSGLYVYGKDLMVQFKRDKQPVSMVLLQCRNLEQIGKTLGSKSVRSLIGQAVKTLSTSAELRSNTLAARTQVGEFALLLPGLDAAQAKAFVRKQFGDTPSLQLKVQERTATVMLDTATVDSQDNISCEQLYEAASARLDRKQRALERNMGAPERDSGASQPGGDSISPLDKITADKALKKSSTTRKPVTTKPTTTKPAATQTPGKAPHPAAEPATKAAKPTTAPAPAFLQEFVDTNTDSDMMSRLEPNPTLPLPLMQRHS